MFQQPKLTGARGRRYVDEGGGACGDQFLGEHARADAELFDAGALAELHKGRLQSILVEVLGNRFGRGEAGDGHQCARAACKSESTWV